jgi:hypothetical protein
MEAGVRLLNNCLWLCFLCLFGCKSEPKGLQVFQLETQFGDMTVRTFSQNDAINRALELALTANCPEAIGLGHIEQDYCIGLDLHCKDSVFTNEIKPSNQCHLRGALFLLPNQATNRIYMVQGRPLTEPALEAFATDNKFIYSNSDRERYLKYGGSPQLDGVGIPIGVVIDGLEIIDKLAALPTDAHHKPLKPLQLKYKPFRAQ